MMNRHEHVGRHHRGPENINNVPLPPHSMTQSCPYLVEIYEYIYFFVFDWLSGCDGLPLLSFVCRQRTYPASFLPFF
jgi:hypothetical protein